jgi:cell division protein FtsQ
LKRKKATKRDRQARLRLLTGAARVILTLALVGIGIYGLYYARQSFRVGAQFELVDIEYWGGKHSDQNALTKLIQDTCPQGILAIDLERVRTLVEGESWVKSAIVRRKLPDKLVIHLTERKPVAVAAIDNELYVVDDEGVVLDGYGPDYQSIDRPIVKGLSNVARENSQAQNAERIQLYLTVIRDLASTEKDYTKALSEIDVSNPERVAVLPADEPVTVYLGSDHFLRNFETYLSQKEIYYRLKEEHGLIEYIDVSYENKVIFHTPDESISE